MGVRCSSSWVVRKVRVALYRYTLLCVCVYVYVCVCVCMCVYMACASVKKRGGGVRRASVEKEGICGFDTDFCDLMWYMCVHMVYASVKREGGATLTLGRRNAHSREGQRSL